MLDHPVRKVAHFLEYALLGALMMNLLFHLRAFAAIWRRVDVLIYLADMLTELPPNSFFFLREGLFAATPEFVYLRMARLCTKTQLAEIGMNLCGRYYINVKTSAIEDRTAFLTTPES